MDQFDTTHDELQVGGLPLSLLAERVGQTPFYAYDRSLIAARVAGVRQVLPQGVHLHYAIKANPMPALVGFMRPLVDGMDVASAGELKLALDAGADPRTIGFAGPGKRDAELRQAVAAGVLLHVESARELEVLAASAQALGRPARVALRINPDFELRGAGMHMGGGPKPFGIDAEQVPAMLRAMARDGLAFEGFHIYPGSQNLRGNVIAESLHRSVELVLRLVHDAPAPVRYVNLGGGWGIPYVAGERRLDLAPVADALAQVQAALGRALPEAQMVLELGRYLVGEAGIYVARVIDRKVSRGQVFLVTDGGMHQHLAASGNFGQVIRRNYPVVIGNRLQAAERESATVVGPLCTPLDVLAERMELAVAQPGDLVVVLQSGAYGATASPQAFLGHPPCAEVLV
ncbi:pyridoxal-dependent decarboxylase, exosortase A system-associated [Alicycliphilus denitrificans]|uniref:pyridoxal-dependent decarboxylase, exosortase A system-associated n=1 Tax=Alicycliphilus denitrificans TaxID=179636 RepID=UPI0009667BB5|nr:pyridoxal-dependent decarboxylase, exosortase A system-associated [Alicycliphilus denitrificans]MBN9575793.1 pyridoxal-dependent decarboxylase, exosortase A system-associated [Alicycliphilus denitrificans]OJW89206.1 MAG: pyridoxal-dependent decarboxylase, exosortase A system-associated [Alicycliphilus sp. 69-12]BCN37492.1 pyridoxal-dependent decarboxylase, exosortase A system-associated [Alicycliphilus denitrificans]